MDPENLTKYLPLILIGGLVVVFAMGRGGKGSGPQVIQTGPSGEERTRAAELLAAGQLEKYRLETEAYQAHLEAERDVEIMDRQADAAEALARQQAQLQMAQLRQQERMQQYQIDAEREANQRESNNAFWGGVMSFIGTILPTIIGLSGDIEYSRRGDSLGVTRPGLDTQWRLLDNRGAA